MAGQWLRDHGPTTHDEVTQALAALLEEAWNMGNAAEHIPIEDAQ